MTTLAVKVHDLSDVMKSVLVLHKITRRSIAEIELDIQQGKPIFLARLFYNDHNNIAIILRQLISSPILLGRLKFYELDDDEDFTDTMNERKSEVVENILLRHEEEISRQQDMM